MEASAVGQLFPQVKVAPCSFRNGAFRGPKPINHAARKNRAVRAVLPRNGDGTLPRTAHILLRWWNVQPYQMRTMVTFVAGIALPRMRSTCKYSARAQMATQRPIAACADKVLSCFGIVSRALSAWRLCTRFRRRFAVITVTGQGRRHIPRRAFRFQSGTVAVSSLARQLPAQCLPGTFRALSSGVFTAAMDVSGLPPIPQRARNGWGTRSCVNTQLENAVILEFSHFLAEEPADKHSNDHELDEPADSVRDHKDPVHFYKCGVGQDQR
jgi:hypothetical protein